MNNKSFPSFEELEQLREQYNQQAFQNWLQVDLFSLNWWLLLLMMVVPWIIWWKLADRKRLAELLIYGMLVGLTSTLLCIIGYDLMLWGYPSRLVSFMMPPLFPLVLSVMPVAYMLVYQYFPTRNTFAAVSFILSALAAFVIEPLMVYMHMYVEYHWSYWYSFPIYFLMAVGLRKLTQKIISSHSH
ncbi:MAG TPA: CBO0543 family protein [Bacilli bacterium]